MPQASEILFVVLRDRTRPIWWAQRYFGRVTPLQNWRTRVGDYLTAHRLLPDCLVLGWLATDEPLHAAIAIDEVTGRLFVVTVYEPSPEEWEDDWRTRKR